MTLGFYKNLAFVIILLLNLGAHAQSSLVILSEETNQPLPYASIVNHTKQQLFFSNEKGVLENNFETGDSISISYVGYLPFNSRIDGRDFYHVSLKTDKHLLKDVKIKSCSNWTISAFDNLAGDSTGRLFGGIYCGENPLNAKTAILLESSESALYLESISIWLEKFYSAPRKSIEAPIQLSFYEKSDSTGLPGELLTNRVLLYHPKKQGKQTISTDSLHIKIPINGLYLCMEFPVDENLTYPVKIINSETGIKSTRIFYGPRIEGIYSSKNVLAFYN